MHGTIPIRVTATAYNKRLKGGNKMKTIKAICFTLLMFVVATLQAQVIEEYRNDYGDILKEYMIDYDSLVYVPAQNWDIQVNIDNYYKDDANQIHAVAQIAIGPDAHLAKAAIGNGLTNWHIVNDSVPTVTLTAGTTQDIDFVIENMASPGTIYVLTENKYYSGLNGQRNFYTQQVQVQLPDSLSTWTSLGKGILTENCFFGSSNTECEFFVCDQDPSRFRIHQPFHNLMVTNGDGSYNPFYTFDFFSKDAAEYLSFRILPASEAAGMEELVMFDNANTGYYHSTYGADIHIIHPSKFADLSYPSYWTYNKVRYWQENGMPGQVQLAPYYYMFGVGGWDYTQQDGAITLTFPGYVAPNHSMLLQNIRVETQETGTFAVAELSLGADVKDARAIVVPQTTSAAYAASQILNGYLQGTSVETGTIAIPFNVDVLGTSDLQLVVAVIEDAKVIHVISLPFKYTKPVDENSFVTVGTADYTYSILFTQNGAPYLEEGLELQQNTDDPTMFRLLNWGVGTTFTFYWNQETNRIDVPEQSAYEENGSVVYYVADIPTATGNPEYYDSFPSVYDPATGTATLWLYYFDQNGNGAYNTETMKINLSSAARGKKVAPKGNNTKNIKTKANWTVANSITNFAAQNRIARLGNPVWAELSK